MQTLGILRRRPELFFSLAGIRLADFHSLADKTYFLWQKSEHKRLSYSGRQRAIWAGRKHQLSFETQLLMCLIYHRTHISHGFLE
jgi:hypothetical protein